MVGVADVAAAEHRRLVVGGERLVVHAPIAADEVAGDVEKAQAAIGERVEQPHLDALVRIESRDHPVLAGGVQVVEEDAHPNAALGSPPDGVDHQPADSVGVPGICLDIERPLGRVGELHQRRHRPARVAEEMHAALPGTAGGERCDLGAECRPASIGEGEAGGGLDLGQPRARSGEHDPGADGQGHEHPSHGQPAACPQSADRISAAKRSSRSGRTTAIASA